MAAKLGLTPKFVETSFDGVVPGIQGRRYDLAVFGVLDKKSRHSMVNLVDDINTSTSIVVRQEDASGIASIDDLCGKRAGAGNGTAQVTDLQEASKRCVAANRPPVQLQVYSSVPDMFLALTSNRTDAALNGTPPSVYRVDRTPGLAIAGKPYRPQPYGIVVSKDRPDLAASVHKAMQALLDEGTYLRLVRRWNLESGALTSIGVNTGK
ncbi:polar amino acid transport system substrate-binding protein [Saccharopolyspora phatthalungensis]|uniref:Polar amino acid transport system substrate-binding protein n=1 Tax=Saccharopolyspora phatthalungensis TaxID=664693 RepID=A0A840QH80_9PSEU|nr:polar amino acid transport system substrate-binding protein [Saccharopolyspora phatthalungensis]